MITSLLFLALIVIIVAALSFGIYLVVIVISSNINDTLKLLVTISLIIMLLWALFWLIEFSIYLASLVL